MRLKLDENLSRILKDQIGALGHDVQTVADEGLLSQPDSRIVAEATTEGRMLLTLDVGLADARVHPPGSHAGIILFRPASLGPITVNRFIEQFVARHDLTDLRGCLVVVDGDRVRVRR
jgi:predicted nuclease of predicted toxin-antitoxin system